MNGLSFIPDLDRAVQLQNWSEYSQTYDLPLATPDQIVVRPLGLTREELIMTMLLGRYPTPIEASEPEPPPTVEELLLDRPTPKLSVSGGPEPAAPREPVQVIYDANGRALPLTTQAVVNIEDIDFSGRR